MCRAWGQFGASLSMKGRFDVPDFWHGYLTLESPSNLSYQPLPFAVRSPLLLCIYADARPSVWWSCIGGCGGGGGGGGSTTQTHSVIDTLGLPPCLFHRRIPIRLMSLKLLRSLLHDGNVRGRHRGRYDASKRRRELNDKRDRRFSAISKAGTTQRNLWHKCARSFNTDCLADCEM